MINIALTQASVEIIDYHLCLVQQITNKILTNGDFRITKIITDMYIIDNRYHCLQWQVLNLPSFVINFVKIRQKLRLK